LACRAVRHVLGSIFGPAVRSLIQWMRRLGRTAFRRVLALQK
jgi:hypothetical protein